MRLKKIDRYILTELLSYFVPTCLFFFITFFMFQTLRLSDFLIVHKVPIGIVARIALCLLVSFSHFVYPTAFLCAVLMGFGRLSAESELVALQSSGISTNRLAVPVCIFALGVGALTALTSLELAPWGERTMTQALYTVGARKAVNSIQAGTFNTGFFDLIIYADEVDQDTGALTRVFMYDAREVENPVVVVAKTGELRAIRTDNQLTTKLLLKLYNGSLHRAPDNTGSYEKGLFKEYSIYLRLDVNEASTPDLPRMASYQTLLERMHNNDSATHYYKDHATEFWKRLSLSFSPVIFGFLGIGLGTFRTRSTSSRGVLFTLATALVYWETLVFLVSASNDGKIEPFLAMQLPNLLVGIAAFFAYRHAKN